MWDLPGPGIKPMSPAFAGGFFFFFFFLSNYFPFIYFIYFIYLFIYFWLCWVFGSCEGFLWLRQVGATPHRGARASHHRGPSRCGAQAPDAQAQHGRWILNHCATRQVPCSLILLIFIENFYLWQVLRVSIFYCDMKDFF